jgi:type 1 fimbria pilin
MRGQRWFALVSCSVAMMVASTAVRAGGGGTVDSGTITFSGAVVEPTCSAVAGADDVSVVVGAAQTHQSLQRNCSMPVSAGVPTDAPRPYQVNVVNLSGAESDRVLSYFANYVRAAQPGAADPMLVTQTYE